MRKKAVNIVAFGNIPQLLRSFWGGGWDVKEADKILAEAGIGWMLLPLRKVSKNNFRAEVFCYEDSWNTSEFLPALKKLVGDLKYAAFGSPTSQKGASALDRVSGMNFGNSGTIVDWLLFGTFKEGFDEYQWIRRRYRDALETVHSLNDGGTIIEVHPEFRREISHSQNIPQEDFPGWLITQDFPICVDTFHLFQRGSRDGIDRDPVVRPSDRLVFLQKVHHRIGEVHFRLSKEEIRLILEGKARELPLFDEMKWLYLVCREATFVLELYPDLFSNQAAMAEKVVKIWNNLEDSFIS